MATQFAVVPDTPDPESAQSRVAQAGTNLILLGLSTLSKRAVAAIADLFMLATVGSAWWLWWSTPDPNVHQIVGLSIYATFVLTANFIVRKVR